MSKRLTVEPIRSDRRASALIVVVALSLGLARAHAQTSVPNAVQGFSDNRDQPIRIEADAFEVRKPKSRAVFSDNVKVIQGDTTMTSKSLEVLYTSQPLPDPPTRSGQPMQSARPGPGGNTAIKRLEARGDVVVTRKDQTARGQRAIFDTKTNLISLLGDVVLTQCGNVMRGDRLLVDMASGVSRVEVDHGKVIAMIQQRSDTGCQQPAAVPATAPRPKR
ncbi:LptA/OstA family protein [Bradyrhizobium sp. STM 3809]|uniref:LptA/OstA family protein n=1 Tax=Bradyrhizobium sp. STM 3809 TaxID=551936 RepID=UPI00024082DE|nr:LptA/OstA family protein [Bradyrhizobium sp. STM 3809]CCE03776.1 conserved exported hypothetical protein [Bradyrhizobium sp. STM 3809]